MADNDDDLHDRVSEMADRLKLKGRDRSQFVHEAMTRGGYRAVPTYVRNEDHDDDDSSSGFFGSSRGRSRNDDDDDDDRPRSRRRSSQSRSSSRRDGGWYDSE